MTSHAHNEPKPIPVTVSRHAPEFARHLAGLFNADLETDLRRAQVLANWLDAKFTVAGVRFGFDTLLGLVPGLGDTVSTLIGLFPLHVARRHKLGRLLQARMAGNLLLDWTIGLVPLLGDAFDTAYKANLRNLKLLEKAISAQTPPPPR